jgi:acyl dehydratase
LRFLDERNLAVLPTFAVTLCTPGMWIRAPDLGIDWGKLLHIAQTAEFFQPLPPSGAVKGTARVASLTDRGEGRGAILIVERTIFDAQSGALYCQLQQTVLLRADGGFGGEPAPREPAFKPARDADATATFVTSRRAALIYRLSGDWNPLHLDPAAAAYAGFSLPILHGLASYGIAGIAVSQGCGRDPARVANLGCRFSGVVLPGDRIDFHIWHEGDNGARFLAYADDRKVLDNGAINWTAA